MKKFLLLSVVALGASVAYAQDDITPASYHYFYGSDSFSYAPKTFTGANIGAPVWQTVDGDTYYNDGLVVLAGGQYGNPASGFVENLKAGTAIVNLGGEVGKVLAISGQNSTINEELKKLYGDAAPTVPLGTGGFNWGNFNWFFNPNNCPVKTVASRIRVRITLNVYSKALDTTNAFNKIYCVDNQGNVRPKQTNDAAPGTAITLDEFLTWEEGMEGVLPYIDDNGDLVWNPNRWLVYELDADCPDIDENGVVYSPLRLKAEHNFNSVSNMTIFIRDIEFIADNEPAETGVRYRSYKNLIVDPSTGAVDKVEAIDENAPVEYYNLQGVRVANPENGLFIVKQGNKVSKKFVK